MENNLDVVDLVSSLLDNGKYKEALSVPNEEKLQQLFKNNCCDLISIVVGKINDDTAIIKPSLQSTCEELLSVIVLKATPEEALLECIEQIEVAKNDAQFSIILAPLQQILKKLSIKRGRSLEWCLNSISTYVESIPIPDYQLEGKERLLMDCDTNVRRITRVYSQIPPFYNPFIKEIAAPEAKVKTKQIITAFLISLLGKPLIYLNLDPETNITSEARQCCAIIVQDICIIEKDALKFLVYLENCNKESLKQKPRSKAQNYDDEIPPYEQDEKVNMHSLSGLFYTVFSGHFKIPDLATPQVYSIEYVVNTALLAVVHLLGFTEYGPLSKATALCSALLDRLPTNAPHTLLSSQIHFDLCKKLVNAAIYSTHETIRKEAVKLINLHTTRFHYKGRCVLIKYLLETANHSGMIGYAITLYKNSIDEAFKNEETLPDCFTGNQLMGMIKKICHLPHGPESDLIELADQIISALNFLRYLTIKDMNNVSGIRNCYSFIETEYLEKLRIGLNMSKAHYEVKLKDVQEGKNHPEDAINVSLNVGGNILDSIPGKTKEEIINSALNAFHLIEGLLARLSECISVNKMQGINVESLRNGRRCIIRQLGSVSVVNTARSIRAYSSTAEEIKADKPAVIASYDEEHQYEEDIKTRILENALQFVSKSGWSVESLTAGAEAMGYPGVAHGLFPNGGGDLVHYFNVKCNEELVAQMKTWPKEELKDSKVPTQFVEKAIITRLLMIEPYKSSWPKAMAIQAIPNNVPNCLATLLSLVDDICYHSGDRSVDFNWYIRRVGLAGIYKATELFYLTDSSAGNTATKNFVASRIRDAQLIQTALSMNPVAVAPQTLTAAFVTAKNILGINALK